MTDLTTIFSGGFVAANLMDEIRKDPEAEFLATLCASGMEVDHLQYETMTRVRTASDKGGERSGWYIYYPGNIPAAAFGDWRNGGETMTWCFKQQHELSPAEWMENKRRMEEAKKKRMEQIEADQRRAAGAARDIISESQEASDHHPYLMAKGVKSHGLKLHDGKLIVPAINADGEIVTIQTIDANGNKLFLKGGKKSGSFFWIEGSRDTIYICEGYATGATIREVTGCSVVVAFDAGNLPKVAPFIREKFLSTKIVLAADNDQHKGNDNAGIKCSRQAAELIKADVVIPQFTNLETKPTDFNDLSALEGLDSVRKQLSGASGVQKPTTRFALSRVGGLEICDVDYIVDKHIESDSFNLIFGEPGCGKSFISIDIACCVATGTPWHGHPVKKGLVVYIAGEGHNGLARRFKAWEIDNGISLETAPLYKSHKSSQLYDIAAAMDVAEAVSAIAEAEQLPVRMVIVDTVARNMGGDENSTQDMNKFIEHIDSLLRHPHKSAIVLVHHSGKASPGQARGSTALRGALDAEYQVEMDNQKMITMCNKKMKDGDVPPEKKFSIKKIGLGVFGREGSEICGAALETVDVSGLVEAVKAKGVTLTKNQNSALNILINMIKMRELNRDDSDINIDDWRESCIDSGIQRNRFHEAKDALVAKKEVVILSNGVVRIG